MRRTAIRTETAEYAAKPDARIKVNFVIVGNTVTAAGIALIGKYFILTAHISRGSMPETNAFAALWNNFRAHKVSVLQNYRLPHTLGWDYAAIIV